MSGPVRTYSADEHAAFRSVSHRHWNQPYKRGDGPAEYAGGPYWPGELRRLANQMERLIPRYRLAAVALEREIATDPRCTPEPMSAQQGSGGGWRGHEPLSSVRRP